MNAYVIVHGADRPGIIHSVSKLLYDHNINILKSSDKVVDEKFLMTFLVDIEKADIGFRELRQELIKKGDELEVSVFLRKENALKGGKKLIIFDVEGTIVDAETLDELAKDLGLENEIAEITRMGMEGKITFQESVSRRLKLLEGVPISKVEEVARRLPIMPGAKETIRKLKESGYKIGLVSGGFTALSERLKEDLEIDYIFANELKLENGAIDSYSGTLIDGEKKLSILKEIAEKEGIHDLDIVAVGDGANDILMIQEASVGIAFNPKPSVKKVADGVIKGKNLKGVLHALGEGF